MATRVGINGFGRIGRNIMRAAKDDSQIDIVAVNDITDAATLAHLLKYDSVLGNLDDKVAVDGDGIRMGKKRFRVIAERDPRHAAVGSPGSRRRPRIDWSVHEAERRRQASGGWRQASHHHSASEAARFDTRARRQPRPVRPSHPSDHLKRLMHDELSCAGRQGARRAVRAQTRVDDHRALVYQ